MNEAQFFGGEEKNERFPVREEIIEREDRHYEFKFRIEIIEDSENTVKSFDKEIDGINEEENSFSCVLSRQN